MTKSDARGRTVDHRATTAMPSAPRGFQNRRLPAGEARIHASGQPPTAEGLTPKSSQRSGQYTNIAGGVHAQA